MKRFLFRLFLFSLPIALFYAFPLAVIFFSKEYYTIDKVVTIQNANPHSIYGNTYNVGSFIPYKTALFQAHDPKIFALGSSRTLQIRKEFFSTSSDFINAGLAGRSIADMKYFIENIATSASSTPRTLILVIDREMFLLDPGQSDARIDDPISLFGLRFHLPLEVSRGIYLDYFLRHKYSFTDLIHSSNKNDTLGIRALADGNGFRSDGSYRNHLESEDKNLVAKNQTEANAVAREILNGKYRSTLVDQKKIEDNLTLLRDVLSICKNKNITVVGFTPPYMTAINEATFDMRSPVRQEYIDMTNAVSAAFASAGFGFYNLSDIHKYNGSDSEFIDTVHGTDVMYAKLSLYLAEHDATMKKALSTRNLTQILEDARGDNFLQF